MRTTHHFEAGDLAAFNGKNGDTYVVSASKEGHLYCSCPAWKFQRSKPEDRSCKHITEYLDATVGDRNMDTRLADLAESMKQKR